MPTGFTVPPNEALVKLRARIKAETLRGLLARGCNPRKAAEVADRKACRKVPYLGGEYC